MAEDIEGKSPDTESEPAPAELEEQASQIEEEAETKAAPEEEPEHVNALKEKRGRLVIAGLVAAVVLSVIALGVAAIFQITTRWATERPTEPPPSNPAFVLWNDIVSEKKASKPLGVPEKLIGETGLKTIATPKAETLQPQ